MELGRMRREASKVEGQKVTSRCAGVDFMPFFCDSRCRRRGRKRTTAKDKHEYVRRVTMLDYERSPEVDDPPPRLEHHIGSLTRHLPK